MHIFRDGIIGMEPHELHITDESVNDTKTLEKATESFLLALKEWHHVTQVAINFSVQQVENIISIVVIDVKRSVINNLKESNIEDNMSVR